MALDGFKDGMRVLVSVDVLTERVEFHYLLHVGTELAQSLAYIFFSILRMYLQTIFDLLRTRRVIQHVVAVTSNRICGSQRQALQHRVIGHMQKEYPEIQSNLLLKTTCL